MKTSIMDKIKNNIFTYNKFNEIRLKRPNTPFFIFCSKFREMHKKANDTKKYTAKELGKIWKDMSDIAKSEYIDEYKKNKREYDLRIKKLKEIIEQPSDDEDEEEDEETTDKIKTNKNEKTKAETLKSDILNNNRKPCNCGKCEDCKNRIQKKMEKIYYDYLSNESLDSR